MNLVDLIEKNERVFNETYELAIILYVCITMSVPNATYKKRYFRLRKLKFCMRNQNSNEYI